jgi:hypothetical protein
VREKIRQKEEDKLFKRPESVASLDYYKDHKRPAKHVEELLFDKLLLVEPYNMDKNFSLPKTLSLMNRNYQKESV